jgi:hypothetical protein
MVRPQSRTDGAVEALVTRVLRTAAMSPAAGSLSVGCTSTVRDTRSDPQTAAPQPMIVEKLGSFSACRRRVLHDHRWRGAGWGGSSDWAGWSPPRNWLV